MRAFVAMALLLAGCQLDEYPTPVLGSTYRLTEDRWDDQSDAFIDILTNDEECAYAKIDDIATCRPKVDRRNAEVHLSFVFRDKTTSQTTPRSLTADQIEVQHAKTTQTNYELIPHDPRDAGQLYIVLIDGSGSMNEVEGGRTRIEKVRNALQSKTVQNAFFPPGATSTGVMLMMFTDELRALDGGKPKIIRGRKEYLRQIREHLRIDRGGYTYLYKAVREGTNKLLRQQEVREFLSARTAQPTLIVLTDGFNNEAGSDTCATNVRRLDKTLKAVQRARAQGRMPPTVWTVGLGKPYRKGGMPESIRAAVTTQNLCGKFGDARIDGLLEKQGIDHVSLEWLAKAGGGGSYVRRKAKDLAAAFAEAAAKRYAWFEIRYRVLDPLWHRQSFETRVQLRQGGRAGSAVTFLPNPWLDAPTARVEPGERWMTQTPLRHAFSILMPILGGLVFLSFLGAAFFNATRAFFRRARPRK